MTTEELIGRLAAGASPVEPDHGLQALAAVVLAAVVPAAAIVFGYGLRPDLASALLSPMVAAKTALPLLLAALALPLCLRAVRPGTALRPRAIWAVPLAALGLLLLALVLTPAAGRGMAFVGKSLYVCLPSVVVLSLPVTAALIAALRRGAPVRPALCGALAGLTGGAVATALYSLYCTEDSPLFYAVWYSLGIAVAALAGALMGVRLLRW